MIICCIVVIVQQCVFIEVVYKVPCLGKHMVDGDNRSGIEHQCFGGQTLSGNVNIVIDRRQQPRGIRHGDTCVLYERFAG